MNAVTGTKFVANFPIFEGNYPRTKYVGDANIEGIITLQDVYSKDNNKHWIYFKCTKSNSDKYVVGKQYKKQGKNFYPKIVSFEYPENYEQVSKQKDEYKKAIGINTKNISEAPIPSFHGSPHNFDEFDAYYIGTGEGNQAFGWGLYFTQNKKIASDYYAKELAEKLAGDDVWDLYDNKKNRIVISKEWDVLTILIGEDFATIDFSRSETDAADKWFAVAKHPRLLYDINDIYVDGVGGLFRYSANNFEVLLEDLFWDSNIDTLYISSKSNISLQELRNWISQANLRWVPQRTEPIRAFVYHVILWPNKEPDLLKWNDSITQGQRNKIINQAKIEGLTDVGGYLTENTLSTDGSSIYANIPYFLPNVTNDQQVSQFLLRAGIDGIIYPVHAMTGGMGDRGWNYVVFDDKEVKLVQKEIVTLKENIIKENDALKGLIAIQDQLKNNAGALAQLQNSLTSSASGVPVSPLQGDSYEQTSNTYQDIANQNSLHMQHTSSATETTTPIQVPSADGSQVTFDKTGMPQVDVKTNEEEVMNNDIIELLSKLVQKESARKIFLSRLK